MKKILLLGNGYLSKNIQSFFKKKKLKFSCLGKKNKITFSNVQKINLKEFSLAVILFGKTRIKYCEKQKKKSFQTNVIKIGKIINFLTNNQIKVIFISSDLVFSGKKNIYFPGSKQDPTTEYGKHKKQIENLFLNNRYFSVLRVSKIFTNNDIFFLKNNHDKIRACCPILISDFCSVIYKIILNFKPKIFNFSSKPVIYNDHFLKKKLNKKNIIFPKMVNNIFRYYKRDKELTNSLKILKVLQRNKNVT